MWSPDSSIAGGAITGWTTPTFGLTTVVSRSLNAARKLVTSLSGTGLAVVNSTTLPFFIEFTAPAAIKSLPPANPVTGLRGSIPVNTYKLLIGKGGYVAAGVPALATATLEIKIPAGMETNDGGQVAALVSVLAGLLNEESDGLYETLKNGAIPPPA